MIITIGTCRINTSIDYTPLPSTVCKYITTNTSQIVIFIKYNLNLLTKSEYEQYNNIKSVLPFLKCGEATELLFDPNNTIFIELSTQKKHLYKDSLLLPHDYTRPEIDINNIINHSYVSIQDETKDNIIDNLLYIKSFFPKIVIVTHIKNHNDNKTRDNFIDLIKTICNELNIICISPCDYIDINRKLYLKDTEHYSDEGYKLMHNIFNAQYIRLNDNIKKENLFVIVALNYYKYFAIYQIYTLLKHNKCDVLLILDNYKEDTYIDNYFITKIYEICNKYRVKITIEYLPDKYDYNNKMLFDKIDDEQIINNCKKIATPGVIAKFIRWIIPFKYFNNYKYVYIGDVDILFTESFFEKESLSYKKNDLFKVHEEHCSELGIDFSNGYRKNQSRITGLHFFINENYEKTLKHTFESFEDGIEFLLSDKYKERFLLNYHNANINLYNDETFLYYNQDEESIKTLEASKNYRPLHGFHIGGTVRSGGIDKYDKLTNTTKKEYDLFYEEYIIDSDFLEIHNIFKNTPSGSLVDKSLNLKNM